jgi:hypothetical protein
MLDSQSHPSAIANLGRMLARSVALFDPPPDITVSERAVRNRVYPSMPLVPQVKSWIDNVIVPTLVGEYLASGEKMQRVVRL